jgi:hypothetical protein
MGRGSVLGTATRHGLDGPEIETRCGWHFSHPPRPTLVPSLPYSEYRVISGGRRDVALTKDPLLALRLKKEYSCTSLPLRAIIAVYRLYFNLRNILYCAGPWISDFNVCGSVHLGNMFYSYPTGCTVQYSFFLISFLLYMFYGCDPDDGCLWHPKHVEQKSFQGKRILYIQLDLNKTLAILLRPIKVLGKLVQYILL